jgi:hypothetical protein
MSVILPLQAILLSIRGYSLQSLFLLTLLRQKSLRLVLGNLSTPRNFPPGQVVWVCLEEVEEVLVGLQPVLGLLLQGCNITGVSVLIQMTAWLNNINIVLSFYVTLENIFIFLFGH